MKIIKKEIKAESDLPELKDMWARLENGPDMTMFQTYEWNRLLVKEWHGWKLHALYSRVFVYTALNGSAPVMMMPVIQYKFSTKTKWFGAHKGVYFLGQGSYSDYMDAIYEAFDPNAFEELCSAIRADFPGFRICLTAVREASPLAKYLMEKKADWKEDTVATTLIKPETAEEYQAMLSKNTRAHLRKDLNRMARDNMDYHLEIMGPIKDKALLDQLVRIHVKRILIKNTKTEGFLHIVSAEVRKVYRKYRDLHNNIIAMSMNENENSVVVLVKLNGKVAGYQYGVKDRDAIRLLQTCFDAEFKFYGALFRGSYDFILKTYEENSFRIIDFTRGDEGYKQDLGGSLSQLYEFTV